MIPSTPTKGQHKLVKIVWKDAFAGPQGWLSLDDYETGPAHPTTIGWLLEDVLDGYITTADTFLLQDGDITYYNVGHIPVEMILSMEVLESEKKTGSKKRRTGDK